MIEAADPMLAAYLAGRDRPCPQCDYNLRDLPGTRCPECGDALVLRLGLAEPRQGTLIAGLIGLSAGAGLSGLLLVFWAIEKVRGHGGGEDPLFLAITCSGLVVEAVGILVLVRRWPRLRRRGAAVRGAVVLACWGLTLANVVTFSLNIR